MRSNNTRQSSRADIELWDELRKELKKRSVREEIEVVVTGRREMGDVEMKDAE